MTYQTNNPVGSVDVRDLYDNAEAFDNFSAGPLDAYADRFGVSRQSLQGIRNASQYVDIGPYAAGLVFTSRNQVFSYLGEFYAPGPSITLPYTTTGAGAGEIANFRSVGDATLRSDLDSGADPAKGAALVGYRGRTVYQKLNEFVSVKDFGAIGDNASDDTSAIIAAYSYAATKRLAVYWPPGEYRTSATLNIPSATATVCAPGVVLQNISGVRNFAAVQVNGNGQRHTFGVIDGYADAIVVRNSTNWVEFQVLSNCIRGVVISAVAASSLDNRVYGTQIGLCSEAIVFEQSGVRTQQGNELRINFVSQCKHTLVFDDLGTHTGVSNWDSNLVELMASDPFYQSGATLCYNKTAYPVSNINLTIATWAGGWNPNDGTIKVISGRFSASQFDFNFASILVASDFVTVGGRADLDSCQVKLRRNANLGSAVPIPAVNIGDPFFSGIDLQQKRFRISCVVPDLSVGQSTRMCFRHVLAQTNYGGNFRIVSVERGFMPLILNIRNSGTEQHGWVSVWFYNPSAATVPGATYDLIIEAGD